MAADLADATGEAAKIAAKIGSAAADVVLFVADLSEEIPLLQPVLRTLRIVREKVETVKSNPEDLTVLHQRCTYITACFIVKCRHGSSDLDVAPLEDCVNAVEKFVERYRKRGKISRVLKAIGDKGDMVRLKERLRDLEGDLSLAGIASLERMGKKQEGNHEELLANTEKILRQLPKPPAKVANVPKGTPTHKSWHVERRNVTETVFQALDADGGPHLVGLVGDSGAGKTTAASAIVSSIVVREAFSDGIVWLPVNEGAQENLPCLMLQLAQMVFEDIGGSVGRRPSGSDDGLAYIKQQVENGHGGKGMKCLVVADNVWESDVVSKLLETGMWILLSTRDEELVKRANGEVVGVDELSEAEAESVLRRAAELSPDARLPDDAMDLIELCGRVAMDLAFVGRWSTVRGRQDRTAWSDAAYKVRAKMNTERVTAESNGSEDSRVNRRRAILQAGFEDLAIGSDDERVQRLYLSLAVLPDGHAFTIKDAAVLLYDREPGTEDEASVGGVVETLERWTIIRSVEASYRMHDAHSNFARESLMDRGDVRRPAIKRLVRSISSLEALRSIDRYVLKHVWAGVQRVGGDGWATTRPYEKALEALDESNSPLFRQTIEAVAWFQEEQEDWTGANRTWRRLLAVEEVQLGADHPYVLNTYRCLAKCAEHQGNVQEAKEWHRKERQALPVAMARVQSQNVGSEAAGLDDAGSLASLAATVMTLHPGERGEAEKLLRRSLEIKIAELGQDDVQVAVAQHDLGVCIREAGRLDEAEILLRRCLEVREAKLGPDDLTVAGTLHDLGICVREAGRLDEAEESFGRCLEIKETKLDRKDVEVALTLYELGECVRKARRLGEAEQLLGRCLGIVEAEFGGESAQVANTLCALVQCARERGDFEDTEKLLRRCLDIKEAQLGREDVQVASTLHDLGACILAAGRTEEAERLLKRCLQVRETKLGPQDVEVASTLYELSSCLRRTGQLREEEQVLRRCLWIVEDRLGPENIGVVNALRRLETCVREAGRLGEAEGMSRRLVWIQKGESEKKSLPQERRR
ncbi:unnamed protein product [Ectocarpus sp. 13 AM-2016]